MRRCSLLVAGLGLLITSVVVADVKLDGVKCIVAKDKAANAEKSVDFKGGKIYFCCDNCPKAFAKDEKKYEDKAKAQLVQTEQAKQSKCPLSGGDLNKDTEITVAGAKVQFCCNMCKGKVEKASGDEQLKMVFGEEAWKKADFKVEKK